jgi:hypothetical protein
MDLASRASIEAALQRVAELLAFAEEHYAVVVIGGAALNLLGIVDRPTTDVDVLAFMEQQGLREPPESMPAPLARAIATVARDLALDDHWMNTGPALQWQQGLPEGLGERVQWRHYGPPAAPDLGLDIGLVSRLDLIFFKLYAAADYATTRSVHYKDLIALSPASHELTAAADWVRPQTVSPEFHSILDQLVSHVRQQLRLV